MREGHGLGGPRFCGAADRPLATEITEDTEIEEKYPYELVDIEGMVLKVRSSQKHLGAL